jgi:hypothetical protein
VRVLELLDALPLESPRDKELAARPPELLRALEAYEPSMLSPIAEYGPHAFYRVELPRLADAFQRWRADADADASSSSSVSAAAERTLLRSRQWEDLTRWANAWNDAQEFLAARAHAVSVWHQVVRFAAVDCRDALVAALGAAREQQLLKQLATAMLTKLCKFPAAPTALTEPLASLAASLLAQLRFGDDAQRPLPSAEEAAVAAATGRYALSLCVPATDLPLDSNSSRLGGGGRGAGADAYASAQLQQDRQQQLEPLAHQNIKAQARCGLARLSREEHRQLLEGSLEALRACGRAREGLGEGSAPARVRASLYAALLVLLQGARARNAEALLDASAGTPLPAWVSERGVLQWDKGQVVAGELHEARLLAAATLEALHSRERGGAALELAASDATESEEPRTRLCALALVGVLLQCDAEDRWLAAQRRRGLLRHLLSVAVDRLREDRLWAASEAADHVYAASVAALVAAVNASRAAAVALVESSYLAALSSKPLVVLCDKRTLDHLGAQEDPQAGQPGAAQEQRHALVLPFLRLVLGVFCALSGRKAAGSWESDAPSFQQDTLRFLKAQRRMVQGCLSAPPQSLGDIEEAALALQVLSCCAANSQLYAQEMGPLAADFDAMVFDLIQELCAPRRLAWKDAVQPTSALHRRRAQEMVLAPPDAELDLQQQQQLGEPVISLFQLDVLSQKRRLLQLAIAYCRARKAAPLTGKENGTPEACINALVICTDSCARSLAAVARASGRAFLAALSEHGDAPKPASRAAPQGEQHRQWSQSLGYVNWTCSSLLFVLEGALAVLLAKLKALRDETQAARQKGGQDAVARWLRHSKVLANHFDSQQPKSPLEQLEEVVRANAASSQFVHLMLRRMREL